MWQPIGRVPQFPTEAWVKHQIRGQLKCLEIWHFMPQGTGMGRVGIPDFICCANSHFIGIEAKKLNGVWSEAQQAIAREIDLSRGVYIVVDELGLGQLWDFLTRWIHGNILPYGVHDFRGERK